MVHCNITMCLSHPSQLAISDSNLRQPSQPAIGIFYICFYVCFSSFVFAFFMFSSQPAIGMFFLFYVRFFVCFLLLFLAFYVHFSASHLSQPLVCFFLLHFHFFVCFFTHFVHFLCSLLSQTPQPAIGMFFPSLFLLLGMFSLIFVVEQVTHY